MNHTPAIEIDAAALRDPGAVVDFLKYASYCANRGYGMTQAELVSIGFDPRFEALYAAQVARAA